ncbi:hypothetical protein ScPMuIL_001781 [Solemya velum]
MSEPPRQQKPPLEMKKRCFSLENSSFMNFITEPQSSVSKERYPPAGLTVDDVGLSFMTNSMHSLYDRIGRVEQMEIDPQEGGNHAPSPDEPFVVSLPQSPQIYENSIDSKRRKTLNTPAINFSGSLLSDEESNIYYEIDDEDVVKARQSPITVGATCSELNPPPIQDPQFMDDECMKDVNLMEDDDGYLKPDRNKIERTYSEEFYDDFHIASDGPSYLRVKGLTENISREVLFLFFENSLSSSGYHIQDIEFMSGAEAIVRFQDEDSLQCFLDKGSEFILEGVTITVEKCSAPTDLSVEPHKLFIAGLKPEISEECLLHFLESKSQATVNNIDYDATHDSAVITFDQEPDYNKLSQVLETRTIEGARLTVSKVTITNCVKVMGLDKTRVDMNDLLLYYFENHRRSGGGPIDKIRNFDSAYTLIYFQNIEDAASVCAPDRTHVLEGIPLSVSLYWDPNSDTSSATSSFRLPEPVIMAEVNFHIVHFLKKSPPNRKVFEQELKKCHAAVVWPDDVGRDALKFICVLSREDENAKELADNWPTEVTTFVRKYLAVFNMKELSTIKEAWAQVIKELENMTISHPDGIAVITKKNESSIVIVGHKSIVTTLETQVSDIIQKIERQVLCTEPKVTKTKKMKRYQIILLRAVKFTQDMETKVPDVAISVDLTIGEVTFQGSLKGIEMAQLKMHELLNSFVSKKMDLSKEACDLLYVKETEDYIKRRMMNCNVLSAWDMVRGETGLTLYGRNNSETEQAVRILKDSLREVVIRIPRSCQAAFTCSSWTRMTNRIVTNHNGHICLISKRGSVLLVATDDIFDEIRCEIKAYLNKHFILEEVVPLPKGLIQFLKKFKSADLKDIEESLTEMDVSFEEPDSATGIIVKGNPEGLKRAKMSLEGLRKSVYCQKHFISKPGIGSFFSTQKGLDVIGFIEMSGSCVIERIMPIPGGKLYRPIKKAEYNFNDGRRIVVMEGDMTQLKVDAITNAANNDMAHHGGLAKVIVHKAGQEVQKQCSEYVKSKGSVSDGDVILSGPGKLPCRGIIHAVGPKWVDGEKGESKSLSRAVENTLKLAADHSFTSIAIPALSAGIFQYPVKLATAVIVKVIQRYWFFKTPKQTSVRVVYLCGVDEKTTEAFCGALKIISGGVFSEYNHDQRVKSIGSESDMEEEEDEEEDEDDIGSSVSAVHGENSDMLEVKEVTNMDWETVDVKTKKIKVSIVKGELAHESVDVIVNTVGQDLKLDRGAVSQSILRVGGPTLQTDCAKSYPHGISMGGIAVSRGGNLNCRYVYHCALMGWNGGDGEDGLRSLVSSCLIQSSYSGMSSIAFPALGSGKLGFPADVVAATMFDCVRQFEKENQDIELKDVRFVLHPKDTTVIKAFEATEMKYSTRQPPSSSFSSMSGQKFSKSADASERLDSQSVVVQPPMSYKLGTVTLELVRGDITKETTDVIVNSTQENLDLSKGTVSNAILKAAGREVQEACNNTASRTKIKQDGFVKTTPGRLKCQVIIHLKAKKKASGWRKIVAKCLEEADKMQFRSISLPALGTGVKGCNVKAIADSISDAILGSAWSRKLKCVRHIRLVIFQPEMLNIFSYVVHAKAEKNSKSLFSLPAPIKKDRDSQDDTATFMIYAGSMDSFTSAASSLNSTVDEAFTHKLISNPYKELIMELKPHQVKKIEELGEHEGTQVTVTTIKGQISLNGRSQQVLKANDAISHYLRNIENDKHKKNIAAFMKVQWCYAKNHKSKEMQEFSPEHSASIEMAYTKKKPTVDVTDRTGVTYRIDFASMTEYDIRRPKDKIPVVRNDLSVSAGVLPSTWSSMPAGKNFVGVKLWQRDKEYIDVAQKFNSSLTASVGVLHKLGGLMRGAQQNTGRHIVEIYRIQNLSLYRQYTAKKKQVEQHSHTRPVEHTLWHGTSVDVVESINENGFDRGYCGRHGTALGAGVYFAVNASYSVSGSYCAPDKSGHCHIYMASVITGDPVQGSAAMKVLPPKNPKSPHIRYDSAVDNVSNPGVFVIFHDTQAYPSYHIVFK